MIKIIFCILSHNRAKTIKKTINSILVSDLVKYEILIYDDNSEKETVDFLKSIDKTNNITVIYGINKKFKTNKSYGRNEMLRKAINDNNLDMNNIYIRFSDDDDYFNSIAINKEINKIRKNNMKDELIFINRTNNVDFIDNIRNTTDLKQPKFYGIGTYYVNLLFLKKNNLFFDETIHNRIGEDQLFYCKMINNLYSKNKNHIIKNLNYEFSYYSIKTNGNHMDYFKLSISEIIKIKFKLLIDCLRYLEIDSDFVKIERKFIYDLFNSTQKNIIKNKLN